MTHRWREMDSNLYGAFPVKWLFWVYSQFFVRRCVQVRLACSAGDSPAGVKSQSPVVRIAEEMETEPSKPIDKVPSRFVLEFDWRGLQLDEDTWSSIKGNRLIGGVVG